MVIVNDLITIDGKHYDINDPYIIKDGLTGEFLHRKYSKYLREYTSDIILTQIGKGTYNRNIESTQNRVNIIHKFTTNDNYKTCVLANKELVIKIILSYSGKDYPLFILPSNKIKFNEIHTRLNLIKGIYNPDTYFLPNEIEFMDKPKPYRKFDNTYYKQIVEDIVESPLSSTSKNSSELSQIKANILKRNIEMGVESLTYNQFEGKTYTYGIELETCRGRLEEEDVFNLNWKAVHDGSLREEDGSNPVGGEYVSGILVGDAGLTQLHNMCRILNKKCEVDKRTGVHVHIGNLNWNKEDVVYSYILAQKIEEELFSTLPASRRTNTYCRAINKLISDISILELNTIKDKQQYNIKINDLYDCIFTEVSGLRPGERTSRHNNKKNNHPKGSKCGYDKSSQRYTWLNYVTLLFNTKGVNNSWTLEFRPMSGTLNYVKIKNWLKLCMAFCSFVENHKALIKNSYSVPLTLNTMIIKTFPRTGEKLNKYINERKQIFMTADETVDYITDKNMSKKTMKEVVCAY